MADLPHPDHVANLLEDEPIQPEPAPIILHHAPAQPEGYVVDDDMEDDEEEDLEEDPEEEPIEQDYDEELEENEVDEDDDEEFEEDGVGDGEEEEMEIDDEMDNSEVINPNKTEEGELPPHIPANPEPEAEAATVGTGRLIDPDDVHAKNNRLRMMLDCSENFIRTTHGELDRLTWDPYVTSRDVAPVPATDDNDTTAHEDTSPSEP
ncbi:hypothetical protein Tco_0083582 [Tanacetum coccineum]